jgi:hypothetical protein
MAVIDRFQNLEARLKTQFPRAAPWIWFAGLYLAGMIAMMIFAYGLKWLIKS